MLQKSKSERMNTGEICSTGQTWRFSGSVATWQRIPILTCSATPLRKRSLCRL